MQDLSPEAKAALERADRLAAHRQKQTERAGAETEAAEMRELEAFDLAESLEAKLGGARDVAFGIVNNRFGVFAVRKPDTRGVRTRQNASEKQRLSLEWEIAFLRHYIEPPEKAVLWMQTGAERPGLVWQTGEVFIALMGVDTSAREKK